MNTKVDYTKMRRNSMIANKYICVCPNCGKKGLRFVYLSKNGKQTQEYMHEGQKTLNGVEMTKSCQVVIEVTAKYDKGERVRDNIDPQILEQFSNPTKY